MRISSICRILSFAFVLGIPASYAASGPTMPELPLHTEGATIRDARGQVVRLTSVNWFGFDEGEYVVGGLERVPLQELVQTIRRMGFNSVRLPWANQVLEDDPRVPAYALAANPDLQGKTALQIMDIVIRALTSEGLMVILDNHVSRADWCCNDKDGNGLWYNREYPEAQWLADWQKIVRRYQANPAVIGADLRNELRSGARWGGDDPAVDWHAAAQRGGNAILQVNPNLLIFVEGTSYSLDFTNAGRLPVRFSVPHRLVYAPHDYAWSQPVAQSYEDFKAYLDRRWGYLRSGENAAPIWMGEIGYCQNPADCGHYGEWLNFLTRYIAETGVGWGWWALNGTQSSGAGRLYGKTETFGLVTTDYRGIAAPDILKLLEKDGLQPTGD